MSSLFPSIGASSILSKAREYREWHENEMVPYKETLFICTYVNGHEGEQGVQLPDAPQACSVGFTCMHKVNIMIT